jgi:serine protease Do
MDYSDVIQKVKPSTALVVVTKRDAGGKDVFSSGSGFVYREKGKFATCNHVIDGATKIQIRFADSATFIDAVIHKQDVVHDLAILNFTDDSKAPLCPQAVANVKEGNSVLFCGFPLNLLLFMTHQGMISGIQTDQLGHTVYAVDGSNNKGNSGGPLLDKNGNVIGVMRLKVFNNDGDNLFGHISNMQPGAVSIHGSDLVTIYQRLIDNLQLGVGVAEPSGYLDAIVS